MIRMRSAILTVVALSAGLPPAAGLQPSAIVFDPTVGLRVHTVYESSGSVQFVGFPGLPDTSIGAYHAVVGMTRRVVEPVGDSWVVETSFDSSRAQYRTGRSGTWQALPTPAAAIGPVRSVFDARLQERSVEPADDEWAERLVRALRGVVEPALPEQVVAAGDRWHAPVEMPYAVELPGDPATIINLVLNGRATAIVDSVVPRPADTLAYVSLQGGLNPVTVDTAYVEGEIELPVTIWGAIGSTLVWSSGWDAWVSGSSTLRMHHRVETAPLVTREITASYTIMTQFRIRP